MDGWNKLTAVAVAQDDERARPSLAALAQAGVRCRTLETFATGELAFSGAPFDVLLNDAGGADADQLWHFLHQLREHAKSQPMRVVAAVTLTEVDIVAEGLFDIRSEILCDADAHDLADAVLRMAATPARTLHDHGNAHADKLLNVRGDVDRLAATLRELTSGSSTAPVSVSEVNAATVRRAIWERRERERFFNADLFADPAWDMLLDLFLSELEGRQTCVSSLCIAAATPPTTALRWISAMTDSGLFEREPDINDRRRHFLRLSDAARRSMAEYFRALGDKPRA